MENFTKGMRVRYVPTHANGDKNHLDCEDGIVSSKNESYIFVKYDNLIQKMITGNEPYTAEATEAKHLIKI